MVPIKKFEIQLAGAPRGRQKLVSCVAGACLFESTAGCILNEKKLFHSTPTQSLWAHKVRQRKFDASVFSNRKRRAAHTLVCVHKLQAASADDSLCTRFAHLRLQFSAPRVKSKAEIFAADVVPLLHYFLLGVVNLLTCI